MILITIPSDIFYFTLSVAIASFGLVGYFYLLVSARMKRILRTRNGEVRFVLFQRFFGAFFIGFLPMVLIIASSDADLARFGVTMPGLSTLVWALPAVAIIIPMNYFETRSASNLIMYPQIRLEKWPLSVLILSGLGWSTYLLAYEFLFRGIMFFTALAILGLWPAIIVTTALYSVSHLLKGFKESLGAIPMGIFLGLMTFYTGNIWAAVITHITLGLTNEWFSLRAQPNMRVVV